MPIVKPAILPRWGEVVGSQGVAGPNELAPSAGRQDSGWVPGEEPPAGYFNWFKRLVYDWIQYLAQGVFTATAGSGLPGVSGTGDTNQPGVGGTGNGTGPGLAGTGGATAPGVAATAGGGGAPARGALALAIQSAPSAPADGDLWATVAALFARIAGSTFTIGLLEAAQTLTGTKTFAPTAAGANGVTATGQTTGAGVAATGGASGPGLSGTPGGGAAPVRGALALPHQNAPSVPVNGDLWTTVAALFARINGATKTIATVEDSLGPSLISFAAAGPSTAAQLAPGYMPNAVTNTQKGVPMPACILRNLRFQYQNGAHTAGTLTATIHKNHVATALTVSIGTGVTTVVSDTVDSVTFAAGDVLTLVLSSGALTGGGEWGSSVEMSKF